MKLPLLKKLLSKNLIAFATAFVLSILLSFFWLYKDMQRVINTPLNISSIQTLNVVSGMSLASLARQLVEQGWIGHPYYLILEAKWHKKAHLIKAGEYALEPGITQRELLDKIVSGKVIQYSLTIPEGLKFSDILKIISDSENLKHTIDNYSETDLLRQLSYLERPPEGMFYPDTYHFPRGTTDLAFLQRAYEMMQKVLDEEWQMRAMGLPYKDSYEALIMASIIEKETAVASERGQIAGVFIRRLEKGMKLQTDPTVIYAMGADYQGNIRRQDLFIDSPYNTYVYSDLPPTPIASPGRASINAALQPADGEELYFVAKGDGSHQFSSTLEEHNRAVNMYQRNRR
jgi:UPF0755 protein